LNQRVRELCPDRIFSRGISVGCGSGFKEIALVEQNLVSSFDCFELSHERILHGEKIAKEKGLSEVVRFFHGDAFELVTTSESYDFVHWNNSLHHMMNVNDAIKWSKEVLVSGGLFYMDDYIGPNHLQWSDAMLREMQNVLESLPSRFLRNVQTGIPIIQIKIGRPDLAQMIRFDPSEAADSERIMESILEYFPQAHLSYNGGVIYHTALSGLYENFIHDQEGLDQLNLLLMIDGILADRGMNQYATALAVKE